MAKIVPLGQSHSLSPTNLKPQTVLTQLKDLAERLAWEEVADLIVPTETTQRWHDLAIKDCQPHIPNLLTYGLDSFSISLLESLLGWKPRVRLPKVHRIVELIEAIDEAFAQERVETFPLLKAPTLQPIDLFIRFPDKEFLIFAIRSFGEATIVYNERKQTLYYKRGPKGTNKWKPDPLMELSEQAYWLKKYRRDLFGSSRGVRKPMPKVLIIWGETQLQQHHEHLYKQVGEQAFLFLPRDSGACYVIHQEPVIDFIRAHLAICRH